MADQYNTLKCSLKTILTNDSNQEILFNAVCRTHQIVTQTYSFLRLYILHCYHSNILIPILSKENIKMAMKVLMKTRGGRLPTGESLTMHKKFQDFYEEHYKPLLPELLDGKNLSHILGYMSTGMLTAIENNIKFNFENNINRLVNITFKPYFKSIVSMVATGQKEMTKNCFKKDLVSIKKDVLYGSLESKVVYHPWIKWFHEKIINGKDVEIELKSNPQIFMNSMIYINLQVERANKHSIQFFPLRSSIVPKYIPIDTAIIVDLFIKKNALMYHSNITDYKDFLWNSYFNMDSSIFKRKNWNFDYYISTDCFSVSIQFENKQYTEQTALSKKSRNDARIRMLNDCKDMNAEQKIQYKAQKETIKKEQQKAKNIEQKTYRDKRKKEFKSLSTEQQELIRNKLKATSEFPYIDEISKEELDNLRETNQWIVNDPGKKNIHYFRKADGTTLVYTNEEHKSKTKRMKYQRLLENFKKRTDIISLETELSNFSSRTCSTNKFIEYIRRRNQLIPQMVQVYYNTIFRKYKWYGYINRCKARDSLINSIEKTFGKNLTIFHGNWSMKNSLKFISTPGISMKRSMAKRFRVLNMDEYKTSKLNCHTLEENKNLYIHKRKLHSVLTYQMENNRLGCIQRDANASINMVNIIKNYLLNSDFPEAFKRPKKSITPPKINGQIIVASKIE